MSFKSIRAGDTVYFVSGPPDARVMKGKAQRLLIFPTHVVVNIGGRYGTPKVVNAGNYVSHIPGDKNA